MDQLIDSDALPHRHITDLYAPGLGFDGREVDAIGNTLDLLQVSFDLADNVADRELDDALGRTYFSDCKSVPLAVLTYLPAVLASCALAHLCEHFPSHRFTTASAISKMSCAIGAMVVGQGEAEDSHRRVDLLSGRQGLLLCLPFWLISDRNTLPCSVADFEAWAYQFGCTWELSQLRMNEDTEVSRKAWREGALNARLSWPSFGPFAPGRPLAPQAKLPGCLC